jgi:Uma2 family endonuclease
MFWLGAYRRKTPGIRPAANASLILPGNSEVQPDAMVLVEPEFGGAIQFDKKGQVIGLPELAVEVSYSSVSYDLHAKLDAYRTSGIAEYLVLRTTDAAADWFVLRDRQYQRLALGADGVFRSIVLPGLWLEPAALFSADNDRLMDLVRQGTSTPEHVEFVQRLEGARRSRNQPNSGS